MSLGDRGWGLLILNGLQSVVPGTLSLQQLEAGHAQRCLKAKLSLQQHLVPPCQKVQGDSSSTDPAPCGRGCGLMPVLPPWALITVMLPVDQGMSQEMIPLSVGGNPAS